MKFQIGDRAKHNVYKKEGTIQGFSSHRYEGNLFLLEFDDGGMDTEFFPEGQLELIETNYCQCGHIDRAHFDGVMEYHSECLNEWCKCEGWVAKK